MNSTPTAEFKLEKELILEKTSPKIATPINKTIQSKRQPRFSRLCKKRFIRYTIAPLGF